MTIIHSPPPTLPKPHYPSLRTTFLPPLSKVRCCRPKKFGRLPEGLFRHFLSRTNPPKTALSLTLHHILASLVKGEVLSPEKIRATTGGIVPPFFIPNQPFQNRTIPRSAPPHLPLNERSVGFAVLLPSTITLASPRKRGGGTADIIFWLAVQYSDSPTFTILKLFRAVTVGIVNASEAFMLALLSISIPFDPHQPSQDRTIPCSAPPHLPLNERSVGFAVPLPCTITLASPRKRGGGTADIIFWLAVQYSDSPTFTILKLFRAVTVGIVNASEAFMLALLSISIPFDPHQPFQNRTIPRSAPNSCLPCQR